MKILIKECLGFNPNKKLTKDDKIILIVFFFIIVVTIINEIFNK